MSKPTDVTFFTLFPELMETMPPVPASEFWPEWFKKSPASRDQAEGNAGSEFFTKAHRDFRTVKSCPGILDVINMGYIIPLWSDYQLTKQTDGQLGWQLPSSGPLGDSNLYGAAIHPHDQISGYPFGEDTWKGSFKFQNPWMVKTPKGYSCLMIHPFYNKHPNLQVLPGSIDTDVYHELHVNTFFTAKVNDTILFNYGMPLVQIIPYKREEYKMEVLVGDHRTKSNILTQFIHNSIFSKEHYRAKLSPKRYK